MALLEPAELTKELEGTYYSPKMQWWCAHADLIDESGARTGLYLWPALGSLDEAWICSLHTDSEMIDLTTLYQPVGTFKTSRSGVDVQFGEQYIRGTYPGYDIYVAGTHDGQPVSLEVHMTADTPAFEALPALRGITWHYVARFSVRGTLTLRGKQTSVTGSGYLERRRGRFWSPGIDRGLWESIVEPGPSTSFAVPLFYKVWNKDGSIQLQTLTFTVDGKTMVDFGDVEVDIQETAKLPGFEEIDHPMRYRLTAHGDGGSAAIDVVRSPHRLKMRDYFDDPDPRAQWAGIYGAGRASGSITYRGQEYPVNGPSYGSALYFTEKQR
ncbi:MAG TPA: hypothetical protein VGG75_22560 [Trebonia sp.]|jgi:hypothetical protein